MQKLNKGTIKKIAYGAAAVSLVGIGAFAISPIQHADGFVWAAARDNPDIKNSDYTIEQAWTGVESYGFKDDNWYSTVTLFRNNAKLGPEGAIGEIRISDHGTGEVMIADAIDYDGPVPGTKQVIADWREEVIGNSMGPFFSKTFQLAGTLKGHSGGKTQVYYLESIPPIGKDQFVKVGLADKDGNPSYFTEAHVKRFADGWLSPSQRDSTTMKASKIVDGKVVEERDISTSHRSWIFRNSLWWPEEVVVKDPKGNLLYTIKGKFADYKWRTFDDGYKVFDKDGKQFADIEVNDPDYAIQLGYTFSLDLNRDGKFDELGTFYYQNRDHPLGEDSDASMWIGQLWVKLKGNTEKEKIENMRKIDSVLNLFHDSVPVDNESAMFNIEEYSDFLMMFLDRQDNGLAKQERLANAATSADTHWYEQTLKELVYTKPSGILSKAPETETPEKQAEAKAMTGKK